MPTVDPQWLTLTQTLLTFLGGSLLGWFTHRRRERATREEEARAALAKLQMDAFAEVLRNLGTIHRTKARELHERELRVKGKSTPIPLDNTDIEQLKSCFEAVTRLTFLVPLETQPKIQAVLAALGNANSRTELDEATVHFAKSISEYFPSPLRTRRWFAFLG